MENKLEKKAQALALKMLTLRRRSRYELEQYLERKGFPSKVTRFVLDNLDEYGYINDQEFTRWWIEKRLGKRGYRALKQELRLKGIPTDLIDREINALGFAMEYQAATKLVEKEHRRGSRVQHNNNQSRLLGILSRRGFTSEVIHKIQQQFDINDGFLSK